MAHPNGLDYGSRGTKKVYNMSSELSTLDDNVSGIVGGVSVAWIVKAFRMGRGTVERKLVGCPSLGFGKHGVPLYDLSTAASYLVNPSERDISRLLEKLDPKDLPEKLREAYWNAKLKEQRFLEKAGELWATEQVIDKVSEMLANAKALLTLLPDDLERDAKLTSEQRQVAKKKVDAVQNAFHKMILKMAEEASTPNSAIAFQEEVAADEAAKGERDDVWDFI